MTDALDRLKRGMTKHGRPDPSSYDAGNQLRVAYGKIQAVGMLEDKGVLAVKVVNSKGRILGGTQVEQTKHGVRRTEGQWIPWRGPATEFFMHPPVLGEPVRILYTGNRVTSGFAERVSLEGTYDTSFSEIPESGVTTLLSAVEGPGGF